MLSSEIQYNKNEFPYMKKKMIFLTNIVLGILIFQAQLNN